MDALRKRELIVELQKLIPFIQADSIGPSTQKRIVAVLGGAEGAGLVRWFNDEHQTQLGDLLREIIRLVARLNSTAIGLGLVERGSAVTEAATKLPAKVQLLESMCKVVCEDPVYLTTNELRHRFANNKGEPISKRQLQDIAIPQLSDSEKRQVGKKGTWLLSVEAVKRVMASTAWKYREAD